MINEGFITDIKLKDMPATPCKPCLLAKVKKKPIPSSWTGKPSTKLGELIYSNVWGPATTRTVSHAKYYIIFVDDAKRWISIDLMCWKSEVLTHYRNYEAWLKTQFDVNIKTFQSDKGGEYTLAEYLQHVEQHRVYSIYYMIL